jgi:alpha-methylacyl-CoA racemase
VSQQDAPGPLTGATVVEFAGLTPVSVAGMLLAGMGADVIRIDRRSHPADSEGNTLRRGRRSVVLDLKNPAGAAAAHRLADKADVLLEGYRPGVMERLGFGPEKLLADNPGLIYGRLTGWGQDGPNARAAGHDITYLALTGALYPMGPADGPPVPPLNYVADLGAGTLFLLLGVLAALHEKDRSGRGQVVDAAMVDAVPTLAATVLRERASGEWVDERGANGFDGGAPFYHTYACRDGGYIAVGAYEPEFYARFAKGLGFDPADLPPQWERKSWPEVRARFADRVRTRTRAEWEAEFDGTDACVSPVLTFAEAPLHPHMAAREAFREIDGHWQPGAAPKLDRTPLRVPVTAPRRGAETRQVLSEFGLTAAEIEELLASGTAYEDPGE